MEFPELIYVNLSFKRWIVIPIVDVMRLKFPFVYFSKIEHLELE